MGLFIRQDSNRTELQERLAAELQEKAKRRQELDDKNTPDGVTDSNYLKDTKKTTSLAWVWVLIIIAVIAVFFYVLAKLQ